MRSLKKIIWGTILVIAAVLIALNSFEIIDFDVFFDGWWTLFIIVPCFVGLFERGDKSGNLFGLLLGVCLLLSAQDVVGFDIFWKLLIPVTIAGIGLKMIFSSTKKKSDKKRNQIRMDGKAVRKCVAVFCATDANLTGANVEGANLVTCFGGIDCDLRNAVIDKDIVIKTCCIFGGIDILVPDNVKIVNNTSCVFAGVDVIKNNNIAEHTVYIEGFCMFGGIDVK